jgi:hypothetical protein
MDCKEKPVSREKLAYRASKETRARKVRPGLRATQDCRVTLAFREKRASRASKETLALKARLEWTGFKVRPVFRALPAYTEKQESKVSKALPDCREKLVSKAHRAIRV